MSYDLRRLLFWLCRPDFSGTYEDLFSCELHCLVVFVYRRWYPTDYNSAPQKQLTHRYVWISEMTDEWDSYWLAVILPECHKRSTSF